MSFKNGLNRIHAAGGDAWDKVKDPDAKLAEIRGGPPTTSGEGELELIDLWRRIRQSPDDEPHPMSATANELRRLIAGNRVPIRVEFDWTNKIEAFGVAGIPDDPKELRSVIVNVAAILWAASDHPDLAWKELTADVVLHEVLHHIQDELGCLVTENAVDEAIDRARGRESAGEGEDTPQEFDVFQAAVDRAEAAEARVAELEKELDAARAATDAARKSQNSINPVDIDSRVPKGHVLDDTGTLRKVLGSLPVTKDGVVVGISYCGDLYEPQPEQSRIMAWTPHFWTQWAGIDFLRVYSTAEAARRGVGEGKQ